MSRGRGSVIHTVIHSGRSSHALMIHVMVIRSRHTLVIHMIPVGGRIHPILLGFLLLGMHTGGITVLREPQSIVHRIVHEIVRNGRARSVAHVVHVVVHVIHQPTIIRRHPVVRRPVVRHHIVSIDPKSWC